MSDVIIEPKKVKVRVLHRITNSSEWNDDKKILKESFIEPNTEIDLTSSDEFHLWHPVDIDLTTFNEMNFNNALKFCKKWKIAPPIEWKKLWQSYHNKTF